MAKSVCEDANVFTDYWCTLCRKIKNVKAEFYCKMCRTFYCGSCIPYHSPHRRWLSGQSLYGRNDIQKWPLSRNMEMFLVACDIHPNATLTMFCDDHSQLFCSNCFDLSHRQCIKVKPIQQAALKKSPDLKKLSIKIHNIHPQIDRFLTHLKDRKHALLLSYNELELNMIEDIRQSILGDFQESSVNETNANEIEKLRLKITNTLVNSEKKIVKDLQSTLLSLRDSNTHYIGNCSMLHDDLKKCNDIMQKIGINKELRFIAGTKCVFKIQQTLVLLGKVDKVLTLKEKFEHNVRIQSDTNVCSISAICVFPDNQVLVADHTNMKLKLLDQQYKVVFARVLSAKPWAMCQITLLEAAVTVTDENTHEVQFVTVAYRRLKKGRRLKLSHDCIGIAHHQGILFVTSNTALYKYKLNGELISKLYEDASDCCTVYKCDVSPTGDKLYISNPDHHKLLTMDMDGRVLATFHDPKLEYPCGVYVNPVGQLLICGGWPKYYIIQLDYEGKKKLTSLATWKEGLGDQWSVCHNMHTSSLIVGQDLNNNILVFKVV